MALADPGTSERFRELVANAVAAVGSQGAVADAFGISKAYVSKMLRGQIEQIRESTIRKVEERLALGVGYLAKGGRSPSPDEIAALLRNREDPLISLISRGTDISHEAVDRFAEVFAEMRQEMSGGRPPTLAQSRETLMLAKRIVAPVNAAAAGLERLLTDDPEGPGAQQQTFLLAAMILDLVGARVRG